MSVGSIVALVIVAALLLYVVTLYNGLVALKHNAAKALANINVLLKQRHEELPKLVETCRQYMQYEQQTLERVIAARVPGVASAIPENCKVAAMSRGPSNANKARPR